MKKLLFIGLLFMAGNVFGQALTKEQEKRVKNIHKQAEKEIDEVIDNPSLSGEEKKSRIYAVKEKRNGRLTEVITPEQATAVKGKDPVKWDKAVDKIDKKESAKLKAAMNEKLDELDDREKELDSREDDIEMQMKILKKEQEEIDLQKKALKQQRKGVKTQYAK